MREDAEEKRFGLKYSVYRWVLCGTESFKNIVRGMIFSFDFEKWSKFSAYPLTSLSLYSIIFNNASEPLKIY